MRRKAFGILGLIPLVVLGLGLVLGACSKEPASDEAQVTQQPVNWKMASAFSATVPILGTSGPEWTKRLEAVSEGRIRIKFYDPGKLVPALEIFDSVSKGAVDAGWSSAGYWIGKLPSVALFAAVPFGPDALEYMTWIYQGGGLELWREIYAESNMWVTPCVMIPPEASGWFREPIDEVSQLKGMKIRFFGLGGKVVQRLGASVQLLAGGDIFPALERGVLDATEFSMPSVDQNYGFQKIASYYYFPGWHQQSSILELMVNLDRWNELDSGTQQLIEMSCKESIISGLTLGEIQQGPVLAKMQADGVNVQTWSPEILAAFRAATEDVLADEAANDEKFAKVYKSYKEFREDYADWARLSRLPAEG